MDKLTESNLFTLRARFHEKAGDEAQAIADSLKPKMFAKREEREPWDIAREDVAAQRRRQSVMAEVAANEILAAAGFKQPRFRRGRR